MFNATAISQIGMVAWLICLTGVDMDGETLDGIVNSIAIGSFSIGLLSIFFSEAYHGRVEARQVLTLFGVQSEPNNQGAYIAIGFTIFLYRILNSEKNRLLYGIALLVNAYATLKTGSRTGLLTLAVVALALLLTSLRKKGFSAWKGIVLGVLAFVALYYIVKAYLPQNTFERLFEFVTYEGGSNRDLLWENALELYKQDLNPIFGAGWGAYFAYNGIYKVVHNTYLGMLCDVGIIGFLLFFVPILIAIWKLWKKREILPICFFITAAVPAFFIDSINKRYFWNPVILLFLYYNYSNLRKEGNENETDSDN
ncbi:MAG: O-antigen ligase family protein [Acutalibacteraceae bacterium]